MASEDGVKSIWRSADAVCFDVDSTVCTDEAIDELAAFLGVGDKVAALYVFTIHDMKWSQIIMI